MDEMISRLENMEMSMSSANIRGGAESFSHSQHGHNSGETIGVGMDSEGWCMLMCPESEILMRMKERLIHPLESSSPPDTPNSKRVAHDEVHPWSVVYGFVLDRLRAVRQDMIILRLTPKHTAEILEAMLPFYLQATHRCRTEPCSSFDVKLHFAQMDEAVTRLRSAYDLLPDSEKKPHIRQLDLIYRIQEPEVWIDYVRYKSEFATVLGPTFTDTESEMGDESGVWLDWSDGRSADSWRVCKGIIESFRMTNYVRFFRELKSCPQLFVYAALLHVDTLRQRALDVMSVAYKSKAGFLPLDAIASWLDYPDRQDLVVDCLDVLDFKATDGKINFATNRGNKETKGNVAPNGTLWYFSAILSAIESHED